MKWFRSRQALLVLLVVVVVAVGIAKAEYLRNGGNDEGHSNNGYQGSTATVTTGQRQRREQDDVYDVVAFEDMDEQDVDELQNALMDKLPLVTSTLRNFPQSPSVSPLEVDSVLSSFGLPTNNNTRSTNNAAATPEERGYTIINMTYPFEENGYDEYEYDYDTPTTSPNPTSSAAPTTTPSNAPSEQILGRVTYVGNDHDGFFYSRFPLGVCEGDCDTDGDCQEGLYCHQRRAMEPVPHCSGITATTADFCAWDTSYPPPPPPPTPPIGAFRIKLYWEEGYLWQNETYDRQWCMISDYDGYPGNGDCWYGLDTQPCSPNQIYIGKCLEGDPRQWFTLMDVGSTYTQQASHHEGLIGTVDPDDVFAEPKRCLMRQESQIYLSDDCNPADERQRFFALSGSFTPSYIFDKSRFEISQYQGYTHDNCITNAHHPKSGEVVEFHVCEHARNSEDQTSYWQLMY